MAIPSAVHGVGFNFWRCQMITLFIVIVAVALALWYGPKLKAKFQAKVDKTLDDLDQL